MSRVQAMKIVTPDQVTKVIDAASRLLDRPDVVLLDTETTGLGHAEVIEVGVIDARGRVLFEQRVRPLRFEMNPYAQRVHGISLSELEDAPRFQDIEPELYGILDHATVVAWNAPFDLKMLNNSRRAAGLMERRLLCQCAMALYGRMQGRRSIGLRKSVVAAGVRTPQQVDGHHSAVDDAMLVLDLLRHVAGRQPAVLP